MSIINPTEFAELTLKEMLKAYNKVASEPRKSKFSSKAEAIEKYTEAFDAANAPKKRGRKPNFNFDPAEEIKPPREGSLRSKVVSLLKDGGATLDQVSEAMGWEDTPRKSYEAVRLVHFAHGYGLEHDPATGVIKIAS